MTENIPDENSSDKKTYSIELPAEKETVSRLIKALRIIRNYSQTRLGRLIGVQKSQISKLENGNNNISLFSMFKIFTALKSNVSIKVELDSPKDAKKLEESQKDDK